jgi:hypothetical protein
VCACRGSVASYLTLAGLRTPRCGWGNMGIGVRFPRQAVRLCGARGCGNTISISSRGREEGVSNGRGELL